MLADGVEVVLLSWSSLESDELLECVEWVAVGVLDEDDAVGEPLSLSLSLSLPPVCCDADDDDVLVGPSRPLSKLFTALPSELVEV